MLQRDATIATGVTVQAPAGNPKRHTRRRRAVPRARLTTQNGSTRTRPQAAISGKKHPTRTGVAEIKQHTAPNSPECDRKRSIRRRPDTRERSKRALRPQPLLRRWAHPGARNATWHPATDPGVTPTIQLSAIHPVPSCLHMVVIVIRRATGTVATAGTYFFLRAHSFLQYLARKCATSIRCGRPLSSHALVLRIVLVLS